MGSVQDQSCQTAQRLTEAPTGTPEPPRTAYLFPGQGAQFVGMGLELSKTSKEAERVFKEADEILSMPLSKMIFEGPEEELQKTENAQPAIMAMSMACFRAWLELVPSSNLRPIALAGHSLGEYTSLVASGALAWPDALSLVRERGRLMQMASDRRASTMAAVIGLDETILEEICMETGVEIANINADDQIVISGDKRFVAQALDLACVRGARKTIPLAVCGAFHSSFMSPAQEGLADAIEIVPFKDPQVPVIGNATSALLTTAEMVKADLMSQLCCCVQWSKSMKVMTQMGVSNFLEFGPGKILGSLVKRVDRQAGVFSIGDLSSLRHAAGQAGMP
jgi:[acyl-carrier-protein] S-malonyltransferase